MCRVTWEEQGVPKRIAHTRPNEGPLLLGMPPIRGCCQGNHWQIFFVFTFPLIPTGHYGRKRIIRDPALWIMKHPPNGRNKPFIFVKALLDYFSVKGGTPIFGNKIPSQREGSSLPTEGIMHRRRA
jgi:hypothetical protein